MTLQVTESENELRNITGLEPKVKEGPKRFRARLVRAASKLDDDKWDQLSDVVQIWVNQGIESLNSKEDVSLFDGQAEEPEPEPEPEKAKPKSKEPAAPVAATEVPRVGGGQRVKEILIEHKFKIKNKDILAVMNAEGYTYSLSMLNCVCADFRQSVKVLRERGLLKD